MGTQLSPESRFRKHLREERERRLWSQAHLAQLLCDKGIRVHPTTVAKIEAGERAAKIDEIAAIADIFDVSIDKLLSRTVTPDTDEQHARRALTDTAAQAAWQITAITNSLRNRTAELTAFEPTDPAIERLTSQCTRVADTLGDVTATLWETLSPPEGFASTAPLPTGRIRR